MPPAGATIDALRATERLPSPKGVALEVMRLARRPDVTTTEIARAVQADPALSGRLIRAANSSAAGAHRPVVAIGEAVLRLGLVAVRQLVLGFSLVDAHRSGACREFDYPGFWSESLLRGVAAQAIAQRVRTAAPEEVFACGLLANVGALALATLFPMEYGALLDDLNHRGPQERLAREHDALGVDSMELARMMLADWGVPQPFLVALAARLEPESASLTEGSRNLVLARVLRLADQLVALAPLPIESRRQRGPSVLFIAATLGLDGAVLEAIVEESVRVWRTWAEIFNVPTGETGELLPPPAPGPEADVRLRVLVVDADRKRATAVAALLVDAGHEVAVAHDGNGALADAARVRAQVILTSRHLPDIDGIDLVEALRSSEFACNAYILMLNGDADESALVRAFDAGINDYVARPVPPRVLVARLRAVRRVIEQR